MNKIYQLPTTNYQLTGKVIRGDGYGRKLGFPTANIDRRQYVKDKLKVKLGIWAGTVSYQSSINNYQFLIDNYLLLGNKKCLGH